MKGTGNGPRAIALVGPAGAGKTSLAEARARGGSTELNLMRLDWLGEQFVLIDGPGSAGFAADAATAVSAADLALVVVDPDPNRAPLVEPTLRWLEELGLPHALFVNKIDQARGSVADLLAALQPMSAAALVARQLPIQGSGGIAGFVDLALERAYHYQPGKSSQPIPLDPGLQIEEAAARGHMLELLADHDDTLLEQLISDEIPSLETIFGDIARETQAGLVVPVLFGSALNGFGIRRLLKMLRHDTPTATATAARLGIDRAAVQVVKISHGNTIGRLALARVFGGPLTDGAELVARSEQSARAGALFTLQGAVVSKVPRAEPGDIVGIAKTDQLQAGDLAGIAASAPDAVAPIEPPPANCALAIAAKEHKDEVRLSTALNRLAEEDPGLHWGQDQESRETLLHGINDEHLAVTLDRLKRRYGVAVTVHKPRVAYKESIRKPASQRGRHKKQSGGHGQFGDVVLEIRPLERGQGFEFADKITGGAIPKQWIPAVEHGVRDALAKGPLGFPVVDVAVALVDGSFHSVDSSELAFRTAGRIAMADALAAAVPYLLEPVSHVVIHTPGAATSRVNSAIATRRGQMLGVVPKEGWSRWDTIEVLLPEAELQGLEAELRSLSQGMARYEARFDHLAEVTSKLATEIIQRTKEPA